MKLIRLQLAYSFWISPGFVTMTAVFIAFVMANKIYLRDYMISVGVTSKLYFGCEEISWQIWRLIVCEINFNSK